ncbi:MAG: hypothetical protein H7210_05140 [Pyrinomonadaceae bacterium]|nr:hypothetical protein [Phycisphaerales bacterium]
MVVEQFDQQVGKCGISAIPQQGCNRGAGGCARICAKLRKDGGPPVAPRGKHGWGITRGYLSPRAHERGKSRICSFCATAIHTAYLRKPYPPHGLLEFARNTSDFNKFRNNRVGFDRGCYGQRMAVGHDPQWYWHAACERESRGQYVN